MTPKLYDAPSIHQLQWPTTEMAQRLKGYWLTLMQDGTETYISNVRTQLYLLHLDDLVLPITVNTAEYNNSYVCSFYAHYITYATYELAALRLPVVERLLAVLLWGMGRLLQGVKINKTVIVNNWLLSTNLYPAMSKEQVVAITQHLVGAFPDHAITFRSINACTTGPLQTALQKQGYRMVGSRQVYLYDPARPQLTSKQAARTAKNIRRDLSHLTVGHHRRVTVTELSSADAAKMADLYTSLYLKRYCDNNPQFTPAFVALAQQSGFLEMIALEQNDRLEGVAGFYRLNGIMTAPLLGYDTQLPQDCGLYRILSSSLTQFATERGLVSHKSSGVADFKRNRGFTGWIEYTAVYDRHLPAYRRLGWGLLKCIVDRLAIPLIKKFQL
ncbi:MAG: GNAT family N-acetyltransferase [Cyanobacteria bacterium J06632_22]